MRSQRVDRVRLGISASLLAVLAATNRWTGWTAGRRLVHGQDVIDYRAIALAAPHLPRTKLPNQHAQVFVPSYLVGLLAHLLGVNVDYVFRAAAIALILGICLCAHLALGRVGVSTPVYTICMAVLILNTYSFRYYLIVPGYLADLAFVLSIAAALLALIGRRYALAVVAIGLATLTRQSALPVGLAFAWWVAFGAGWRDAPTAVRVGRAGLILATPVLVYLIILAVVAPFSFPNTPGIAGLTILGDFEHLGSDLGALAVHLVRVAHSLLAVASLGAVALVAWRRARPPVRLPFEAAGCLVVGCSIAGQALLLNTHYSGHPERLTVLSLLPFVVALAYVLRACEESGGQLRRGRAAAIAGVLAVGSLQYLFTYVGPQTAAEGVVLALVAAIIAGALLWQAFGVRMPGLGKSPRRVRATS